MRQSLMQPNTLRHKLEMLKKQRPGTTIMLFYQSPQTDASPVHVVARQIGVPVDTRIEGEIIHVERKPDKEGHR